MSAQKTYSDSSVKNALQALQVGVSLRSVSKRFGIPRSTLYDRHKQRVSIDAKKGPSTILTREEEDALVEWIFYVSDKGFPVNKEQLLDSVALLVIELKRETPFTNNRPGRHWYEGFLRRHPELTQRVAQNLTLSRASATEEKLRNWFSEVTSYLAAKNLLNIHPSRIFNCDESAFFLCPKADNVIARKGARAVYKVVNGDEKECLTTLFMVNAAGTVAPPMVMYWYQRIPSSVSQNVPSGWSIGTSERGWMTAETFYEYVTNVFYPWLQKNGIEFPIILFVDGHSSHLTMPLSKFCRDVKIELVALYPNATHILQPLDVAVFHPLKAAWKKTVNSWRLEHNGERLKKEMFAPLLKTAVDSLDLEPTIRRGFESCGLCPFSADAVDFNVLQKGSTNNKTQPTEPSNEVGDKKNELKNQLLFIENNLPANLLPVFIESERIGRWSGEMRNEGLYECWLRIKRLTGIRREIVCYVSNVGVKC